jgi:hypothetical protein
MSALMRAKLVVGSVLKAEGENGYETVTFRAVGPSGGYPEDGSDENNTFAKWTP